MDQILSDETQLALIAGFLVSVWSIAFFALGVWYGEKKTIEKWDHLIEGIKHELK